MATLTHTFCDIEASLASGALVILSGEIDVTYHIEQPDRSVGESHPYAEWEPPARIDVTATDADTGEETELSLTRKDPLYQQIMNSCGDDIARDCEQEGN